MFGSTATEPRLNSAAIVPVAVRLKMGRGCSLCAPPPPPLPRSLIRSFVRSFLLLHGTFNAPGLGRYRCYRPEAVSEGQSGSAGRRWGRHMHQQPVWCGEPRRRGEASGPCDDLNVPPPRPAPQCSAVVLRLPLPPRLDGSQRSGITDELSVESAARCGPLGWGWGLAGLDAS